MACHGAPPLVGPSWPPLAVAGVPAAVAPCFMYYDISSHCKSHLGSQVISLGDMRSWEGHHARWEMLGERRRSLSTPGALNLELSRRPVSSEGSRPPPGASWDWRLALRLLRLRGLTVEQCLRAWQLFVGRSTPAANRWRRLVLVLRRVRLWQRIYGTLGQRLQDVGSTLRGQLKSIWPASSNWRALGQPKLDHATDSRMQQRQQPRGAEFDSRVDYD